MDSFSPQVSHVQIIPYEGNLVGLHVCYPNYDSEKIDYWMTQAVQALIANNVSGITDQLQAYIITLYPLTGCTHLTIVNRKKVVKIAMEDIYKTMSSLGDNLDKCDRFYVVQLDYYNDHPIYVSEAEQINPKFGDFLKMFIKEKNKDVTIGHTLTMK